MHARAFTCIVFSIFIVLPLSPTASAQDHHAGHHEHDMASDPLEPLGLSLSRGWLDPWPHSDLSSRGTPFVHLFNLEPAFLDRDLILSYRFTRAEDERESELEAEIEWALTRRIGLLIEAPYVLLNPEEGASERGISDTVLGGRFLLAEFERLLVSANIGVALPTGSESRGLGSGELAISPALALWLDLGHWITFNAQLGTEHGAESGDDLLIYSAALTWSFRGPALLGGDQAGHADHRHFPPGLTSLIAELSGEVILDGDEDGRATQELILGASYNITQAWELRGGYRLPVGRPRDIDSGYIISLLRHF